MVKFKDFSRPFSVFQKLFKANLIFKDFSRQSCIFKYFSCLCETCFTYFHVMIMLSLSEPLMFSFTYFHVMIMLSLSDPFTLMLTVINCGLAENSSFISQLFCPRRTDLKARSSTPCKVKSINCFFNPLSATYNLQQTTNANFATFSKITNKA